MTPRYATVLVCPAAGEVVAIALLLVTDAVVVTDVVGIDVVADEVISCDVYTNPVAGTEKILSRSCGGDRLNVSLDRSAQFMVPLLSQQAQRPEEEMYTTSGYFLSVTYKPPLLVSNDIYLDTSR
jgi:hypothetical protein